MSDRAGFRWDPVLEKLWQQSRFTSYFFQTVEFLHRDTVPTLALAVSSGKMALYYNEHFARSLPADQLIGLLAHEMMHVILEHDHRAVPGRNSYLANLAQDMVVNSYLTDRKKTFFSRHGLSSGYAPELSLPPGLPLVPEAFFRETGIRDPRWEEVCGWLTRRGPEEIRRYAGNDDGPDAPGDIDQAARMRDGINAALGRDPFEDEASIVSLDDTAALSFEDADGRPLPTGIHLFRNPGDLSLARSKKDRIIEYCSADGDCRAERAFQEMGSLLSRVEEVDTDPWRRRIRSIVDYSSQSSEWVYTTSRFSRRYLSSGLYAPGRAFKEQQVLTVAVDVSASMIMKPEALERAFGAVEGLLGKYRVGLVCVDEDLFIPSISKGAFARGRLTDRPHRYRKGDWRYLKSGTGGTTFFEPLFNRYMKGRREMLIVITDGQVYDLPKLRPHAPTLWIITGRGGEPFIPPFGQTIIVEGET